MTCREFRENHPGQTEAASAHRASCAECRAYARAWDLLGEYPPLQAGPGFLAGIRRRVAPRIGRLRAAVAAAAAAVLITGAFTISGPPAAVQATEEELELVENLEILQDYELLSMMELVSDNGSPLLKDTP